MKNMMLTFLAVTTFAVHGATEEAKPDAAAWMSGRVGIFVHFLPDSDDMERLDAFDATGLARQVAASGAKWFILTLGQNTGYYISPNATYERITRREPFSRCSRRDIPSEVIAALRGSGVRFGLYISAQPPNRDGDAAIAFGLGGADGVADAGSDGNDRMLTGEAVGKWAEVIEEWSRRYGRDVSLWWIDGCYTRIGFDDSVARRYKAAARAGNPDAAVAFNAGVRKDGSEMQSDYFGGETNEPLELEVVPGRLDARGRQRHVLTYMGSRWCSSSMRYSDEAWRELLAATTKSGWAVTLDVAVSRPSGLLDPAQLARFSRVVPHATLHPPSAFSLGRVFGKCKVCGGLHDSPGERKECLRLRPIRLVAVDGRELARPEGIGTFDLLTIYPGEAVKGSNGKRTAEVAFSLSAPRAGRYRVFRHNDYYGEISVNGGKPMVVNGPFDGWIAMEIDLKAGKNDIRYRTRAGAGGMWTWGFGVPIGSDILSEF